MSTEDELARVESVAAEGMRFMAAKVSPDWSGRLKLAGAILAVMLVCAFGVWVGHVLTPQPIHEDVAPAPAVLQSDGSVLVERAPASAPLPPRTVIPKGYHEVRRATVVVAPDPAASSVEVDLSLVRNGTEQRVIASSPDGKVVSAIDVPIEPALLPPAPRPWAAGLSYGTDHAVGLWIDRDIGRLRLGAEVAKGDRGAHAEVRVGLAF